MSRTPALRVLIPTAQAHPLMQRSLSLLAAHAPLVVDDSPAELGPAGLGLTGLRTAGNLGFARAVNQGLERLEAEGAAWILLLNDDALPDPDCLPTLRQHAADEAKVSMLGPLLVGPSGVESAGLRFNPRTARLAQSRDVPDGPVDVDALSGACVLMKAHLRFDPAFSHAMEDVELSLRVRAEGERCVLVPGARCWHEGGGTLARDSALAQQHALSGHLRLHQGQPLRQGLATAYAVGQVLREGPSGARFAGILSALTQDTEEP